MLNLIYAMKIFGHRSVESFRRELSGNSQLRIACGLSEGKFKYCGDRKHLVPLEDNTADGHRFQEGKL